MTSTVDIASLHQSGVQYSVSTEQEGLEVTR
jgi:hypothetical protein